MNKSRSHIFVSGNVQDVFFRVNAVEKANKYNITGWTRNLSDGRVEVVLEGDNGSLQKFIEWAKIGPLDARVDNIEIYNEEYTGEFEDFNIKED